jgi:hypothetical protein
MGWEESGVVADENAVRIEFVEISLAISLCLGADSLP